MYGLEEEGEGRNGLFSGLSFYERLLVRKRGCISTKIGLDSKGAVKDVFIQFTLKKRSDNIDRVSKNEEGYAH